VPAPRSPCTSVTLHSQGLAFDRDSVHDTLTIEVKYHDVGAFDKRARNWFAWGVEHGPDLAAASTFVARVAAGQRVPIVPYPFSDLDLEEGLQSEKLPADWRSFVEAIQVPRRASSSPTRARSTCTSTS